MIGKHKCLLSLTLGFLFYLSIVSIGNASVNDRDQTLSVRKVSRYSENRSVSSCNVTIACLPKKEHGILPAAIIKRFIPEYTHQAKSFKAQGDVVIEVKIDEQGKVINAKVLTGHALLQETSLYAARNWKFKPALFKNIPVKTSASIVFRYKL